MTPAGLRKLVEEIQQRQSELDDFEMKAAKGGTPKRIYEFLSAFANRPGGEGVVVFGLNERRGFQVVGVGDFQRLAIDQPRLEVGGIRKGVPCYGTTDNMSCEDFA